MNISTGGPHILLFERDSQLTALLISEFQLAGYECHTARTAVEVFDAIERYPVRLVLVNLAQAAAGRREFWVALDTKRRGRGIQVLTFHCTNLAGYGARDSEDRSQTTFVDLEVDGMLGLMSLVDAVRTRVPAISTTKNTVPRIAKAPAAIPTPTSQVASSPQAPQLPQPSLASSPAASRASSPLDTIDNSADQAKVATATPSYSLPPGQSSTVFNDALTPRTISPTTSTGTAGGQSYTDKIRAILYPQQPSTNAHISASTEPNLLVHEVQSTQQMAIDTSSGSSPASPSVDDLTLQRPANGQRGAAGPPESGLAELSRMVQERHDTPPEEDSNSTLPQVSEETTVQVLRASPIQDVPVERAAGGQPGEGIRRADTLSRTQYGQHSSQQTTTTPIASLASISLPLPSPSASPPTAPVLSVPEVMQPEPEEDIEEADGPLLTEDVEETDEENDTSTPIEQAELTQTSMTSSTSTQLDTAQTLSPLPSLPQTLPPAQQPSQVQQRLSGRALRSLGSVLLEGHLVPQSRLEVAQNIQRLLRGVDLNYQLGEILLMFKLLTPDQLLAASLVSYGLITTAQITALGRIRQELHVIGLEYDLENLLILFRLLTPEQLREVRASWQG